MCSPFIRQFRHIITLMVLYFLPSRTWACLACSGGGGLLLSLSDIRRYCDSRGREIRLGDSVYSTHGFPMDVT